MPVARHVVVSCLKSEVEDELDAHEANYDLVGMSSCQVGGGFGAHVEVLLVFRARAEAECSLPPGRQRRSPIPALAMRK